MLYRHTVETLDKVSKTLEESKQSKKVDKGSDESKPLKQKSKSVHAKRDRRRSSNNRSKKPKRQTSWSPEQYMVKPVEGKKRFLDFALPDQLLHAIHDLGFEYCTPIQAETIQPALAGHDIIGKAQTGTGKTAAFLVGIITDLLDYELTDPQRLREPRALIIAPTRELALQIAADAELLCKYADLNVVSLVGGMDYDKQRNQLKSGNVDILVATPGRLIDFVRSKDVDLYNVEVLVLDEADRMLSMGFIPDVRTIIRHTPRKGAERQTLLYSATFTDDIMNLARQWTKDPVQVEIEAEQRSTDNISQKVFLVSSTEKYKLLRNYIRLNNIERVIVFGNRRHETRALAERLRKDGVKAALMSGEIAQNKRVKTLEDFRSGKIEVLVATDVAGRGIHIDGVTHVVNYQLPEDPDDYVHRIGRTGRAGATGTSICFACENDSFMIPDIEAETGVKLECLHPDEALLADLDKPVQPKKDQDTKAEPEPDQAEPKEPAVETAQASESDDEQVDTENTHSEETQSPDVSLTEAEVQSEEVVQADDLVKSEGEPVSEEVKPEPAPVSETRES